MGDLLTIRVEESASASGKADTNLSRESTYQTVLSAFLGLMKRLKAFEGGNIDPAALINAASKSTFKGSGDTRRSSSLDATVQVMVRQVLPNGNLFVEGHRVVLVNSEEYHFYISGVARPHDINEGITLSSLLLADADIQYTGRGALTDQQDPSYGQSFMNWAWPW